MKHWILFALIGLPTYLFAQCETFSSATYGKEARRNHVIYRQYLKSEDYTNAFEFWQKAFKIAPAADGKRTTQYEDGVSLYLHLWENETDTIIKQNYIEKVQELYAARIECYDEKGYVLGLQAYDMYYVDYDNLKTFQLFQEAIDLTKDKTEQYILPAFAVITTTAFAKENISTIVFQETYQDIIQLADEKTLVSVEEIFAPYTDWLGCAVNTAIVKQQYQEKQNLTIEECQSFLRQLTFSNCPNTDELVIILKDKIKALSPKIAPPVVSIQTQVKQLLKQKAYKEAVNLLESEITKVSEPKQADIYYQIAVIRYRNLKQKAHARVYAQKALKIRPNWGKPYLLIGDMYAASSNNCGKDNWEKRAVIWSAMDKWKMAKKVDTSISELANQRIQKYRPYLPTKEDGHMKSIALGSSYLIKCWINEKVIVQY